MFLNPFRGPRKQSDMRTVLIALGLLAAAEAFAPVSLAGAPKVCLMICILPGRFWMSVLSKQLSRSWCGPRSWDKIKCWISNVNVYPVHHLCLCTLKYACLFRYSSYNIYISSFPYYGFRQRTISMMETKLESCARVMHSYVCTYAQLFVHNFPIIKHHIIDHWCWFVRNCISVWSMYSSFELPASVWGHIYSSMRTHI